jgi:very-short-patch-repair endonuclease
MINSLLQTLLKPILTFLAIAIAITTIRLLLKNKFEKKGQLPALSELRGITRKQPLTNREQKMYSELTTALPGCTVLAQVAFSALIDTKYQETRNRFDRKVADFVLLTKQLDVIAIIELDDTTHLGKEKQDADRDAMLNNVGYKTLRYRDIPSTEKLQADIGTLLRAKTIEPAQITK